MIEPTGSPVSKFADIRQSDVDPDNDVLLCVGDGIEQYFFQTLLAAVFPYPDHEEALRKCMAGSLSFKCTHDSIVGRSPDGEERLLSPHLVADCGLLLKRVVGATTAEKKKGEVVSWSLC